MAFSNRVAELEDDSGSTQAVGPQGAPQKSIFRVLFRGRWWIVLATIASIASAWFYLSKQIPIYSSSSRLYIQQFQPAMKVGEGLGIESGVASQCDLITSVGLLNKVSKSPEVQSLQILQSTDNPVGLIRSGLAVTNERDFITIAYESPNPIEAAQLVNAIADAYIDYTHVQHQNTAAEVLKILTAEKDKREAELKEKFKATLDFKRDHGVLEFQDDKGNIIMQKLSVLSGALTNAEIDLIEAQGNVVAIQAVCKSDPARLLEMAKSEQPRDTAINMGQSDPNHDRLDDRLLASSEALRAQIEEAERQLIRLRRTRTPLHADVQNAEADIKMLQDQLDRNDHEIADRRQAMLDQDINLAKQRHAAESAQTKDLQREAEKKLIEAYIARADRRRTMAQDRVAQLTTSFNEQKQQAFDLNAVAAEYGSLEADKQRTERLVNMLEDRIKDIHVSEDTGVVNVTVLDVAHPSSVPVRPDRKRILGMGLLLGVMLGVGVAFGLDHLDQRIRSGEEVAALLGAPVLGLVPHIAGRETAPIRGRKVLLEPTSDVAECYRTIRTAIYFAAREQKAKRVLVTSPAPGDGKTTTCSNIAIAMAQAGRRVLLLDADFRRPTQHKIFEIMPEVGLSTVMAGLAPLEKAIHRTDVPTLDLLPCGPIPKNPSELLNGQAFVDLLEGLEKQYDHIVIDSPPVVPVTDARILGALCDDTIIVLRAEKSTRRLAEHAREALVSVGANILGVVVNDVPRGRDRYGYYYGYGYSYKYRYYQYGYSSGEKGGTNASSNGNGHGALTAPANGPRDEAGKIA